MTTSRLADETAPGSRPAVPSNGPSRQREFEQCTSALRPELLAHCYRLLGSVTEAEDQVQETYLRAWKSFHTLNSVATVRAWMYKIATNTCLTALRAAGRRPMPTGIGAGGPADPRVPVQPNNEIPWLEPLPDHVVWGNRTPDPAEAAVVREGTSLAMVAALQDLPAKQRAVLILRDVLQFSAAETADLVDTTVAACNSALQRARATVGAGMRAEGRRASELTEHEQQVWDEFVAAFDRHDIGTVVKLLADDATWEMPPVVGWYRGAAEIGELILGQCPAAKPGDLKLVPVVVNGQPAAGVYLLDQADNTYRPFQLQVADFVDGEIVHIAAFFDLAMFPLAGLPASLPGEVPG